METQCEVFVKTLAVSLVVCGASVLAIGPAAYAAEDAPLGAWRATNDCFLAAFILTEGGHAQAAYLSGEHEHEHEDKNKNKNKNKNKKRIAIFGVADARAISRR
jgi:hypothetical protein